MITPSSTAQNQLPVSTLAKHGLDVTNPSDQALLTQSNPSPNVTKTGFTKPYSTFPNGATLAQALRPFPQFGNIGDQYERDGNTWHDALEVKVAKRMSHGLSGGVGYSWSKDLGAVSSTGTYTTSIPIQNPARDSQEPEILFGHRPAADAEFLLQP